MLFRKHTLMTILSRFFNSFIINWFSLSWLSRSWSRLVGSSSFHFYILNFIELGFEIILNWKNFTHSFIQEGINFRLNIRICLEIIFFKIHRKYSLLDFLHHFSESFFNWNLRIILDFRIWLFHTLLFIFRKFGRFFRRTTQLFKLFELLSFLLDLIWKFRKRAFKFFYIFTLLKFLNEFSEACHNFFIKLIRKFFEGIFHSFSFKSFLKAFKLRLIILKNWVDLILMLDRNHLLIITLIFHFNDIWWYANTSQESVEVDNKSFFWIFLWDWFIGFLSWSLKIEFWN